MQHPGLEKDRVFRADVLHTEGKKSCGTCYGLDNANIVKRRERSDTAPKIHYGTIGSKKINLVVKIKMAELGESLRLKPWLHERLEKELLDLKHRTYLWLYGAIDDIESTFKNGLWP